jgi:hypothetical protein
VEAPQESEESTKETKTAGLVPGVKKIQTPATEEAVLATASSRCHMSKILEGVLMVKE